MAKQQPQSQPQPEKERGLVVYQSRDGQEIRLSFDVVRRFLVSGHPEMVTEQEMILYMGMAKARGLNPFKRDCYLIKYTQNEAAATVVSIDYFRARARAQTDCAGWKTGIILQNEDKSLEWREGSLILDGEKLVGAWFKAQPKMWDTEYAWSIPLAPFIKRTREGKVTQFWREENQAYMICKVVESQGLRRLWPDEFQGLYVEEEIQERDVTPSKEPLKIPQPLKEEKPDDQARATEITGAPDRSTSESSGQPQEAGGPDGRDAEKSARPAESSDAATGHPESGDSAKLSLTEQALAEIKSWTKESFPEIGALKKYTGGQPVSEVKKITEAYAAKARSLGIK